MSGLHVWRDSFDEGLFFLIFSKKLSSKFTSKAHFTVAMPRVLKADLIRNVDRLEGELEKLRGEHAKLRRECGRSRSPRRITESAATSRRVLDMVCRFERDEVVHEQRRTIARQQVHIEALTRGEGQMWPILMARWESRGVAMDSFIRERIAGKGMTVTNYLDRLERLNTHMSDILSWGTSMYDSETSGAAFAAARARRDS